MDDLGDAHAVLVVDLDDLSAGDDDVVVRDDVDRRSDLAVELDHLPDAELQHGTDRQPRTPDAGADLERHVAQAGRLSRPGIAVGRHDLIVCHDGRDLRQRSSSDTSSRTEDTTLEPTEPWTGPRDENAFGTQVQRLAERMEEADHVADIELGDIGGRQRTDRRQLEPYLETCLGHNGFVDKQRRVVTAAAAERTASVICRTRGKGSAKIISAGFVVAHAELRSS